MSPAHVDPTTGRPLRSEYRENVDFAKAAERFVRALARRASHDVDALPLLRDLGLYVDARMHEAVAGCHDEGNSYGEIGKRLGVTRQSVQERYGAATTNGAAECQDEPDTPDLRAVS